MSNQENSSLSILTQKLFTANIDSDRKNYQLKLSVNQIKAKYEPRTEFNCWKQSQEGKIWKKQQYYKQQKSCAICQQKIDLKGSHIDHIKPLSTYPHLALIDSNLQITCWQCNTEKSNQ